MSPPLCRRHGTPKVRQTPKSRYACPTCEHEAWKEAHGAHRQTARLGHGHQDGSGPMRHVWPGEGLAR